MANSTVSLALLRPRQRTSSARGIVYENGVTECQIHFREGQEHGTAWCWYKNGRLCDYAENWEGRLVELKVWKPDGSVCKESQICNGDGVWVVYNEDGTEK